MSRRLFFSLMLLLTAEMVAAVDDGDTVAAAGPLFRQQYHRADASFCNASVCVDFDGDGDRELLFASRKTGELSMLRGDDGTVIWSQPLVGDQQSLSAYDLDRDGSVEILYTVSGPGRLYVLSHSGAVLAQWDSGDHKLGNSAVILDSNADGRLEGFFGSRSRYLIQLDMTDLTLLRQREDWVQCGCHTSAMDVDQDGRWDLFAGSGDDSNGKGVLHRYDPLTLNSVWTFSTNDNASSADAVLVDLDGDGAVEILKSVDNYRGDDAHDGVFAFETDGTKLWKAEGLAGEDSPNAADLDGDGDLEIVGMTFGSEVYCLDAKGRVEWRKDLRPELTDADAHAYLTPVLCDVNGDQFPEIVAFTNGGYFNADGQPGQHQKTAPGIVFALSATGEVLDRFEVQGDRYWGDAFAVNVDDDPFLELVISGSGGLDVIETRGLGPDTEHFQRRRDYQRLNVLPWAYSDSYFIHRGRKEGVSNLTDNLVLARAEDGSRHTGRYVTELLRLPPNCLFDHLQVRGRTPEDTAITVNILDRARRPILRNVKHNSEISVSRPIHLEFVLTTRRRSVTPILDSYELSFRRP